MFKEVLKSHEREHIVHPTLKILLVFAVSGIKIVLLCCDFACLVTKTDLEPREDRLWSS